uniref:RNA polymerase subunit alpha n=1 Tax=Phacus arnoldii TaxID=298292 RepID=UPI0023AAFFE2|nr:RNA polymerase subunit alpha [Phacus arnoldii]WCH63539.1 RNA polymerase subunit alpha [Phacus arnoldii]
MKLLKIKLVKVYKTQNLFYNLFKLESVKSSEARILGNLIRRNLIKNTFFKITDLLFFIKNTSVSCSKYKLIKEYFPLEEIREDLPQVISNFKNILFFSKNVYSNVEFASVEAQGPNYTITTRDICFKDNKLACNLEHYICTIFPSDFKIKVLIKIEV